METYNYVDIYLIRYQNGERNLKSETTIFNNYETEELLGEETAKIIQKIFYEKAFPNSNINEIEEYTDITRIQLNRNKSVEEIRKISAQILDQSQTIGGDGDAFDFFPDLVFAFEQICDKVIELEPKHKQAIVNIFNDVIKYLNEKEYEELGEPFDLK